MDREGGEETIDMPPEGFRFPRLSPDGGRIAVDTGTSQQEDIWIKDLSSGPYTRFTLDSGRDTNPVWTPDGQGLIFTSQTGGGARNLYSQVSDGTEEPRRLTESPVV